MNALTDVDLRFLTSSQKQKLHFLSQTFVLYYFPPPADAAFIFIFQQLSPNGKIRRVLGPRCRFPLSLGDTVTTDLIKGGMG